MLGRDPHFSLHVLEVQSAYIRAAGSKFARNPMSKGGRGSLERPSATSERRDFATVLARMTLQEPSSISGPAMVVENILGLLPNIPHVNSVRVEGRNN